MIVWPIPLEHHHTWQQTIRSPIITACVHVYTVYSCIHCVLLPILQHCSVLAPQSPALVHLQENMQRKGEWKQHHLKTGVAPAAASPAAAASNLQEHLQRHKPRRRKRKQRRLKPGVAPAAVSPPATEKSMQPQKPSTTPASAAWCQQASQPALQRSRARLQPATPSHTLSQPHLQPHPQPAASAGVSTSPRCSRPLAMCVGGA